ncbi:MAG: YqaA family protein [Pseudomonadales bacterium]|nr:YqaA family protein [Pseudomonadales bacterium]
MASAVISLFSSAFLAATILPLSSEILLLALLQQGYPALLLLLVAGTGNVLGSCLNWWLGTCLARFQQQRWFYFSPGQISRAQERFQRFGSWTLLFAWVPVIGDPLTLIAGVMRLPFLPFLILTASGKFARYAVLIWLF